ncbi:hypothetical protein H4R19_002107 [Coemansia spiralis]|nr:hypothetical protein H4R19_002107 [Coemansia spiralis]
MSNRAWGRSRFGIAAVAAAAVGLVGLVGYLVYEACQETAQEEEEEEEEAEETDEQQSSASSSEPVRTRPRARLVVSARGIVVDTANGDRWSGQVEVRAGAAAVLARLAARFEVFIVAVVRPGTEAQVLAALEDAGIVGTLPSALPSDAGESAVWVSGADEASLPSGLSSQMSSVLDTLPGILPRSSVLFCETEEGKIHLARHLLTAEPPVAAPAALGRGCAGYIDTNRDVIARLAPVLARTVLVAPLHADPRCLIDCGDVPGRQTALAQPTPAGLTRPPAETVDDIGRSSLLL